MSYQPQEELRNDIWVRVLMGANPEGDGWSVIRSAQLLRRAVHDAVKRELKEGRRVLEIIGRKHQATPTVVTLRPHRYVETVELLAAADGKKRLPRMRTKPSDFSIAPIYRLGAGIDAAPVSLLVECPDHLRKGLIGESVFLLIQDLRIELGEIDADGKATGTLPPGIELQTPFALAVGSFQEPAYEAATTKGTVPELRLFADMSSNNDGVRSAAFETLGDLWDKKLVGRWKKRGARDADCEDLLQEFKMKLLGRERLGEIEHPRAYLWSIHRSVFAEHNRVGSRDALYTAKPVHEDGDASNHPVFQVPSKDPSPEKTVSSEIDLDRAFAILEERYPDKAEGIKYLVSELTENDWVRADTIEALGKNANAAKTFLSEARKIWEEILDDVCPGWLDEINPGSGKDRGDGHEPRPQG